MKRKEEKSFGRNSIVELEKGNGTCNMTWYCVTVELDVGDGNVDSSVRMELGASEEGVIQEPYVGMEFDSEEAAKKFYDEYAKRVGFVMRIDQCRRSEVDKRILSRRLSCNKQGYYVKSRDRFGPARKPRSTTREGCKAMMLVKVNKAGKWAVTRFEKEHTHPLVISGHPSHDATFYSFLAVEAVSSIILVFVFVAGIVEGTHASEEEARLCASKEESRF
ncbi:hypothetical protein HYC85_031430 [Camellia sinensis]|uniref:FAR1 domain-containing protein n=1 Tax=Camellia sinensis TaxID=4442 RepID=A0A7J7FR88_CAMSI|nr:hypothetical protein HYC85_031430 [Camellia sinensis]